MNDIKLDDVARELTKDIPVMLAVIWNSFIAALPTAILVLSFVYLVIQIGFLLRKWKLMNQTEVRRVDAEAAEKLKVN